MAEIIPIPQGAILYPINIDIHNKSISEPVYSQQYDYDSRYIVATVWNNGALYPILATANIEFACTKPDSKGIDKVAGIDTNGNIVYKLDQNTTAVNGIFDAEFRITDSITGRKATPKFKVYVEKSALDNNTVISSDDFDVLTTLISEANEAIEEIGGIVSTESTRVFNENQRILSEDTRKENEIERIANESTRISEENARKESELARIRQEEERQHEENIRNENENDRILAEELRPDYIYVTQTEYNALPESEKKYINTFYEITDNIGEFPDYLEQLINESIDATQNAIDATGDVTEANNFAKQAESNNHGGVFAGDETDNAKYYKDQSELAKIAAEQARDEAEAIVGVGIATTTKTGIVKGGGNVTIAVDGQMDVDLSDKLDKNGDSKDNIVTFTESTTDDDIKSGDTHEVLFGKIAKNINVINNTMLDKLNIGDDYRPNILDNGDLKLWNRGKNINTSGLTITADRWVYANSDDTVDVISLNSDGAMKVQISTANKRIHFSQYIQQYSNDIKGKSLMLSFEIKADSTFNAYTNYSNENDIESNTTRQQYSITSSYTKIEKKFVIPINVNTMRMIPFRIYDDNKAQLPVTNVYIKNIKLEINNHSTAFIPKSHNEEILNCSDSVGYSPNLLINGDFNINQRGLTTYNGTPDSATYTVDRWRIYNYGGTLNSNTNKTVSVKKVNGAEYFWLDQSVEDFQIFNNKTISLSAKIDGNLIRGSSYIVLGGTAGTFCTVYFKDTTINFIDIYWNGLNAFLVRIIISDTETHNIEWVKLELNDHATPFIPRPIGEELLLCQRYFEVSDINADNSCQLQANGTKSILGGTLFKVRKRISPTVGIYYGAIRRINTGEIITVIGSYNVGADTNGIKYIDNINAGHPPFIIGEWYSFAYVADAEI